MKLNIKKSEGTIALPKSCTTLLAEADASDLKVLLYAAMREEEGAEIDIADAANVLMISETEVNSSIKFWLGAGVIKKGRASDKKEQLETENKKAARRRALPEKRTAKFTANELCEIAEINEEFKSLLDMAQQTAGWIFNTSEIEIIASLYSNLMLSTEYILALISYYVRRREKPLRYLEKVAYSFIDDGIDTAEALEEKLRYLERYEGYEGMVRKLFGLGVRTFIDKERSMLRTWLEEYGYGEDIIKEAYERTVSNTGKASLNYANSILKNWHEKGIKTVKDLESKEKTSDKKNTKTTRAGTATARSFNVDDALSKALERSYKGDDK
ncbi:MAG: DnaD domain protein [Clostridia bacterium]|nr:DnaD domain protein [Clostridia bacterium]